MEPIAYVYGQGNPRILFYVQQRRSSGEGQAVRHARAPIYVIVEGSVSKAARRIGTCRRK